jgi:hypothetical protein
MRDGGKEEGKEDKREGEREGGRDGLVETKMFLSTSATPAA